MRYQIHYFPIFIEWRAQTVVKIISFEGFRSIEHSAENEVPFRIIYFPEECIEITVLHFSNNHNPLSHPLPQNVCAFLESLDFLN